MVGGAVGEPPRLVVAVQAPAVDGKANQAVIKQLADAFSLRARDFSIVFGELGRDKRIVINGQSPENKKTLQVKLEELMGVAPTLM
ncbi:MAG: DUF167 domain-containing protein [Actinobacteria bacterium]|uniref:Unannotated protein n=1 Tax=freshwater metagenome TaxID=449393 RepID=A0A6J6I496_9ZZZZ|nr:DUF167 domain-containing protein [Actinomycetota bacterium]